MAHAKIGCSTVCLSAILAFSACGANAADIGSYGKGDYGAGSMEDPVVEAPRWAGWYVGAAVGGATSGGAVDRGGRPKTTLDGEGFAVGGGYIGYNLQYGPWVVGLEGGAGGGSFEARKTIATLGNVKVSGDDYGSVRLRAGYGTNGWLFYGTVGAEFINTEITSATLAKKRTEDAAVLSAGGGIEYAFNQAWSVRADAKVYGIGIDRVNFTGGSQDVGVGVVDTRLGVSYRW